jgi:hypothetical protein
MANRVSHPSIIGFSTASPDALVTEIIAQQERWGEFIVVKKTQMSVSTDAGEDNHVPNVAEALRRAH